MAGEKHWVLRTSTSRFSFSRKFFLLSSPTCSFWPSLRKSLSLNVGKSLAWERDGGVRVDRTGPCSPGTTDSKGVAGGTLPAHEGPLRGACLHRSSESPCLTQLGQGGSKLARAGVEMGTCAWAKGDSYMTGAGRGLPRGGQRKLLT